MNQCPQCKTVWQDWRKFCENDGCRLVNQVEQGDKPVAVLFDGPHSDRSHDGDEVPAWTVGLVDDNGEDVGEITWFRSYESAERFARKTATERKLEYACEAMNA